MLNVWFETVNNNNNNNVINNIIYIALSSYSFIAVYNDYPNLKTKS